MACEPGRDHPFEAAPADNEAVIPSATAEEVVRSYWERIWRHGQLDALNDLVADPIIRHTSDGSQRLTRAELRALVAEIRMSVRFNDIDWDAWAVSDTSLWVRLTLRGVSLATSLPMTVTWMAQYRVIAGRIVELWALNQASLDWNR